MKYILRDYQKAASDAAINFINRNRSGNGIIIAPTGSGKSLIIADITSRLNGKNIIVFQPSKEILEQNFAKLRSYGYTDCSIYSASLKQKQISRITFATIGSVKNHLEDFNKFKVCIVDECHLVEPKGGMYMDFFNKCERKVIGLTATPYRLTSQSGIIDNDGKFKPNGSFDPDKAFSCKMANMSILKFITRTRPRLFTTVLYQIEIGKLLQSKFLANLSYYDLTNINPRNVKRNSTGRDYDESSLFQEFERVGMSQHLTSVVKRLLKPKSGIPRKGILVFTRFLDESEELCRQIDGCEMVSGDTPIKERTKILERFKNGEIKVLTNVGVLTTGFDYPELDTVVMARPTMSLSIWYQCVGRAIRPCNDKQGWIVDLGGNCKRFGRVEDLTLKEPKPGEYMIMGQTPILNDNGDYIQGTFSNCPKEPKQLTNIYY